ncbi:MAG: DegT/DnrJ/EryC1/StrS family aminotransferase, partial [Planctomycetes bacterium]|nr:DegT/DnrJ/EryC1/StrS family aminotransferase [Planctomycetota bacterium]
MNLAVFTGKPFFAAPQHVGGPIVEPETRERFHRLADEAFDRNWLTNSGPLSLRLEKEVAARHGVAEAVFVGNATLAQEILMRGMGLTSGEALVSANTFVATAHVCEALGVKPVFCDIDPVTLNMDPVNCERKITPDTKVIIPTHVFGVFSDMPALKKVAVRHGIKLIADAAHAFDCDREGVAAGGFGVPEFISFHATKFFSTLEGGAILTNDGALAERMREIRNFGFDRPDDAGKLGANAKGSEISAAFGLASLDALPGRHRLLKEIRDIYLDGLADIPGLRAHQVDMFGQNNYRYFAVFVDAGFGLSRDALLGALRCEN